MTWEPLPAPSTFEKARRKELYRRLARIVRGHSERNLLPLDEVRRRLRAFDQSYVGIRPIPTARIVGTVDRLRDFDREFLPRTAEIEARWKRVEQLFSGGSFPPIVVYQLEDMYFVVDGHHRVAIARQRGMEAIDAEVTRLKARFPVPPGADIGKIILAEHERTFMEESGLDRARPEARIEFSGPAGYVELLELVKVHGYHLTIERSAVTTIEAAAGDWYDRVYLPTVDAIKRAELGKYFARSTEADLFLWIYQRRRALHPETGGLTLEDTVDRTLEGQRQKLGTRARRKASKLTPSRKS